MSVVRDTVQNEKLGGIFVLLASSLPLRTSFFQQFCEMTFFGLRQSYVVLQMIECAVSFFIFSSAIGAVCYKRFDCRSCRNVCSS